MVVVGLCWREAAPAMPETGPYGHKKTDGICDGVCGEVSHYYPPSPFPLPSPWPRRSRHAPLVAGVGSFDSPRRAPRVRSAAAIARALAVAVSARGPILWKLIAICSEFWMRCCSDLGAVCFPMLICSARSAPLRAMGGIR